MPTTSDYLTQLQADKEGIVDNLEERGITVPSGATFTDLVPLVEGIPSGSVEVGSLVIDDVINGGVIYNLKKVKVIDIKSGSRTFAGLFTNMPSLEEVTIQADTSQVTTTATMFMGCSSLKVAPYFDTSEVTTMSEMFRGCGLLETVPVYDTSKCTNFRTMFTFSEYNLTTQSIDNILQMCIGATSFTGTKDLSSLGMASSRLSAGRVTVCEHYQDFLDAGWTIGWS